MSKKNKAKLNKEDKLEKNNSDIVNSESENLEQNSTVANDTDADNEKQNELEENLRDEIEQLRDEKLRLLADMENLRKRSDRDRMDSIRYGNINFARDILSLSLIHISEPTRPY